MSKRLEGAWLGYLFRINAAPARAMLALALAQQLVTDSLGMTMTSYVHEKNNTS
jgi:hypothetical protein